MATFSTIKMAALDITIKRGDTQSIVLSFTDPDDSNNPVDLSVYDTLVMELKLNGTGTPVLALSLGSGLTVSGASNSILTIDITAVQAVLQATTYKYDVEGTITATDFVRTILGGQFSIDQDITNA